MIVVVVVIAVVCLMLRVKIFIPTSEKLLIIYYRVSYNILLMRESMSVVTMAFTLFNKDMAV